MSRRRRADKREIIPDAKYGDLVLAKFMNSLMYDGKKSAAEGIIYGAFDTIQHKTKQDPLAVFHEALRNVSARRIEVKSRRVGGATYQVPVEVRTDRAPCARHPLADHGRARPQRTHHDGPSFGRTSGRRQQSRHARSRSAKTRTRWPTRTAPSPITAGRREGPTPNAPHHPARTLSQYRHCRAYRCRQDDDDRAHPLLHGQEP